MMIGRRRREGRGEKVAWGILDSSRRTESLRFTYFSKDEIVKVGIQVRFGLRLHCKATAKYSSYEEQRLLQNPAARVHNEKKVNDPFSTIGPRSR